MVVVGLIVYLLMMFLLLVLKFLEISRLCCFELFRFWFSLMLLGKVVLDSRLGSCLGMFSVWMNLCWEVFRLLVFCRFSMFIMLKLLCV